MSGAYPGSAASTPLFRGDEVGRLRLAQRRERLPEELARGGAGRVDLEDHRRVVGPQRGGDLLPGEGPAPGGEMEVEAQRLELGPGVWLPAGSEVVVQVEEDD